MNFRKPKLHRLIVYDKTKLRVDVIRGLKQNFSLLWSWGEWQLSANIITDAISCQFPWHPEMPKKWTASDEQWDDKGGRRLPAAHLGTHIHLAQDGRIVTGKIEISSSVTSNVGANFPALISSSHCCIFTQIMPFGRGLCFPILHKFYFIKIVYRSRFHISIFPSILR